MIRILLLGAFLIFLLVIIWITRIEGFASPDLSPRIDDAESYLALVNMCKTVGSNDSPFTDSAFAENCGMCMSSGTILTGTADQTSFTGPTGVVVYKADKDAAILAQGSSRSLFPYAIPSMNAATCQYATNDSSSQPVLAIRQSDYNSFKARVACAINQTFSDNTGSECGRCLDGNTNKWSWSSGDTAGISLFLWGAGTVTVTAGTNTTSPTSLSQTVTNIPLGSIAEGTPIGVNVTGGSTINVYGYIQSILPNRTPYNLQLEKFLDKDTITNSFPKSGLPQTFNGISLQKLIPGHGKTSMNLTGPLPLTFLQSEDLATYDCPSSPFVIKQESWNQLNAGTDPCVNPMGQRAGNYTDRCLQPLIITAGCSSSGDWFSDPSTYAKEMSIGDFTRWLTSNVTLAATNSIASKGCYGRDVVTPCDAYINTPNAIPNTQCLTYLYKNSGANLQSIGTSYPGATSSSPTFCTASGTLSPLNQATATAAVAELTTVAGGYSGKHGMEAVKQYLADIYNKATGNLDSNAPDSAGGRNTSRVKCFGDVALYSPPTLTEGATYQCAREPGKMYRAVGGLLCWYSSPAIASSWDPNWSTDVITIHCDYGGISYGSNMAMNKPTVPRCVVRFYRNYNYVGEYLELTPGSYSYSKLLSTSGFQNDSISSIAVGDGVTVTVYQDDIGSRNVTITQSTGDLRGINMDKTISAIIIAGSSTCIPTQMVRGNNGTVSCETYCEGTSGGPWNGELPASWNGAKCVSTDNPSYGCSVAPGLLHGPTGSALGCLCQKTGTGWFNQPVGPPTQIVRGNNGAVSCETYCKGTGGGPWNGELPASWNGAKCVSTDNPSYGCSVAPGLLHGPTGSALGCLCQKTDTGWFNQLQQPSIPPSVIRIYNDYNRKGPYTELNIGTHELYQINRLPNFINDSASSIELGSGIKSVTLYADNTYTYPSYQVTITRSVDDLRNVYFDAPYHHLNANKTLSSFRIQ